MPTKKEFLNEKLNNFCKWLQEEDINIKEDHPLMKELAQCRSNENKFLLFLCALERMSDKEGNIDQKIIQSFLSKHYCFDISTLNPKLIEILNKYIRCFIKILRC
jgi:hypothetical protein